MTPEAATLDVIFCRGAAGAAVAVVEFAFQDGSQYRSVVVPMALSIIHMYVTRFTRAVTPAIIVAAVSFSPGGTVNTGPAKGVVSAAAVAYA
jgi:hypothetical protein